MAVIANKMAAIISAILLADFLAKAPSTFFVIALTAAFALTKVAFAFLSLALIAAFTLGLVGLRSCFPRAIRFLVALIYAFNVDLLSGNLALVILALMEAILALMAADLFPLI